MRALKIVAGIAVLLNALHFVHAIHHFYSFQSTHGAGTWLIIGVAGALDVLAAIGGVLLLRP
jgi:hypothetical protein